MTVLITKINEIKDNFNTAFKAMQSSIEKGKMYLVDGLCGSGKTYRTCEYILSSDDTHNLIVVPTINLAREYESLLKNKGSSILLSSINSNNTLDSGKSIEREIQDFNTIQDQKIILIITQEAFERISVFVTPEKWSVFHDELPEITSSLTLCIPYHLDLITSALVEDKKASPFKGLVKLKPVNKKHIEGVLQRDEDVIDNLLKPIIGESVKKYKDVYADKKQWNKLIDENVISEDGKRSENKRNNTLFFNTITKPIFYTRFKKIIFIGARIENSVFCELFSKNYGIKFEEFTPITSKLRDPVAHLKDVKVNLYYIQKHRMTKASNSVKLDDDKTRIEEIFKHSLAFMDRLGEKFLYTHNSDVYLKWDLNARNGTKISIKSNGLNTFKGINNSICIAPVNRSPKEIWALKCYGIDEYFLNRERNLECVYQTISRTSIRDVDNFEEKTLIVSDKQVALDLIDILNLENYTIEQLPGCEQFNKPQTNKVNSINPDNIEVCRNYYMRKKLKAFDKHIKENFELFFNSNADYYSKEFTTLRRLMEANCFNNDVLEINDIGDVYKIKTSPIESSKLLILKLKGKISPQDITKIFRDESIAMFGYNCFEHAEHQILEDGLTSGILFISLADFCDVANLNQGIKYIEAIFAKYGHSNISLQSIINNDIPAPCKNIIDVEASFFITSKLERTSQIQKYSLKLPELVVDVKDLNEIFEENQESIEESQLLNDDPKQELNDVGQNESLSRLSINKKQNAANDLLVDCNFNQSLIKSDVMVFNEDCPLVRDNHSHPYSRGYSGASLIHEMRYVND